MQSSLCPSKLIYLRTKAAGEGPPTFVSPSELSKYICISRRICVFQREKSFVNFAGRIAAEIIKAALRFSLLKVSPLKAVWNNDIRKALYKVGGLQACTTDISDTALMNCFRCILKKFPEHNSGINLVAILYYITPNLISRSNQVLLYFYYK